MRHKSIFLTILLSICLALVGCTPTTDTPKQEQPNDDKKDTPVVALTEAEEVLAKMNTAMEAEDDYLFKTDLQASMQTENLQKDMQLFDECRILRMNETVVLHGEGTLELKMSALEGDNEDSSNYNWQYYTEETEAGMNLHYTSNLSGKRQEEVFAYSSFAELEKGIVLNKDNIETLVLVDAHTLELTLTPASVPMLQAQLKQAGMGFSEAEWVEAPAVTMLLELSEADDTLKRISIDATDLFIQWLTNQQIVYSVDRELESPKMTMVIDVYYDREIH